MLNADRSFWTMLLAAIAVAALCFFLSAGDDANQAKVDKGVTTETVATAAGARVLPTDPKLKVEPK